MPKKNASRSAPPAQPRSAAETGVEKASARDSSLPQLLRPAVLPPPQPHASQVELSPIEDPYEFDQMDCDPGQADASAESPDPPADDVTPIHGGQAAPTSKRGPARRATAKPTKGIHSAGPSSDRRNNRAQISEPPVRQVHSRQLTEIVANAKKQPLALTSKPSAAPVAAPAAKAPEIVQPAHSSAPSMAPEPHAATAVGQKGGESAGMDSAMMALMTSMSNGGTPTDASLLAAGRMFHELVSRQAGFPGQAAAPTTRWVPYNNTVLVPPLTEHVGGLCAVLEGLLA